MDCSKLMMFLISFLCFISDDFIHWPTLFIEVLSLDSWERFRTEGYAYITIPSKAGKRGSTYITILSKAGKITCNNKLK